MQIHQTKSDIHTRYLTDNAKNGILSCGFSTLNSINQSRQVQNEFYSCFILLYGYGSLIDEKGEKYYLVPNSCFQLFPGEKYTIIMDQSVMWYEFQLSIGETVFQSLASLNLLNTKKPVFIINNKPYLEEWFHGLLFQIKAAKNSSDISEVLFNTQKLLINIHKENIENDTDINLVISGTKQLLSLHYDEPISLEDIAASFNLSYEKLRKSFKKIVGISPIQYRLNAKFRYAGRLLNEGNSVKSVADSVGYDDPSVFSRQFKKTMGKPPKSYK